MTGTLMQPRTCVARDTRERRSLRAETLPETWVNPARASLSLVPVGERRIPLRGGGVKWSNCRVTASMRESPCAEGVSIPPDGNTNGSANGNNPSWLFPDLLLGPDRHFMQKRHTSLPAGVERRAFPIELRAEDADAPGLIGYAARYNVLSGNLGGFRERILPGAFADAVLTSDIRALWYNEDKLVIGSTMSDNIRVAVTEHDITCESDLPDT